MKRGYFLGTWDFVRSHSSCSYIERFALEAQTLEDPSQPRTY